MFIDAHDLTHQAVVNADICIVGAGPAGITLALELGRAGKQVCLMEAGGLTANEESQSVYQGDIVGLPYTPLEAARIRYFGGTSNHWSGWCWPLDSLDFERREWIPHSGWPFSREHLDPYYARAQRFCDIGEKSFSTSDWSSDAEPPLSAEGMDTHILKFSLPTRFGLKYEAEIGASEAITCYLNASLTQLNCHENGNSIRDGRFNIGVTNKAFSVNADKFILATGGIENAKVLLQSKSVHRNGIGNQNDLVGRYFADHPGHATGLLLFNDPQQNIKLYDYHRRRESLADKISDGGSMAGFFSREEDRQAMMAWIEAGADEQVYQREILPIVEQNCLACHSSAGIAFFRNFETFAGMREVALRESIAQSNATGYSAGLVLSASEQQKQGVGNARTMIANRASWSDVVEEGWLDAIGSILDNFADLTQAAYNRAFAPEAKRTIALMRCSIEQIPNPDSRVTLSDEQDALGQPKVKLDWRLSDFDRHTFEQTERAIGAALGRQGLGRVLRQTNFPDTENWADNLNHGWHHMGTTRMHDSPTQGVVDSQCQVHGVGNLYVSGSSVFPTYGYANPTLTIVALAVRLADQLKANST